MKPSSCKSKGRNYQKQIVRKLSEVLQVDVEKDGDLESRPMGQSGSDIIIRGVAKTLFPFGVECKNVEKLNIWGALDQAEEYGEPLLFFTRNRTPSYVAMKSDKFFELYTELLNYRNGKGD